MRIGHGFDVHKLVEGRDLVIGGLKIDHKKGLLGHSDADVLVHAIMDSILGAMGQGDIGKHFPDTDIQYKDISSVALLKRGYHLMVESGYKIANMDATIIAQEPKLAPYIDEMRENLAKALNTKLSNINVKATTSEWLGYEGRKEGISSHSVCLLIEN